MDAFSIPWKEALKGCKLAIENAERLAEDSLVLKRNSRMQSAYSVSLDGWEELGKAVLLYRYYKTEETISKDDWKRILSDHKHKRIAWANSLDLLYGTTLPKSVTDLKNDLEKAIGDENSKKWFDLERNIGVYVDWIHPQDCWVSPCKIDKPWFSSDSLLPPVFDSEYWARSTIAQCRHFRELLASLI